MWMCAEKIANFMPYLIILLTYTIMKSCMKSCNNPQRIVYITGKYAETNRESN